MIGNIINAIVGKLTEIFPGKMVYTENVKQGFEEPCFFITCISSNASYESCGVIRLNNQLYIQYFPASEINSKEECNDVCQKLLESLELIRDDAKYIRGTGMNGEIVDDILNFKVSYNFLMARNQEQQEKMEVLVGTDTKVKE